MRLTGSCADLRPADMPVLLEACTKHLPPLNLPACADALPLITKIEPLLCKVGRTMTSMPCRQ